MCSVDSTMTESAFELYCTIPMCVKCQTGAHLHSGNLAVGSETVVDSLDGGRLHGTSAQTRD